MTTLDLSKNQLAVEIRLEQAQDAVAIRAVNDQAFGQPVEGRVIEQLRHSGANLLSLVATVDDQIVGHVLFSPATIEGELGSIQGLGLAPVAVLPEYQGRGIGSKLITTALSMIKASTCPYVIVLGHQSYYPRFGFERASIYGLTCQWAGVPDEAFMVMILDKTVMAGVSGVAKYRDEFNEAM